MKEARDAEDGTCSFDWSASHGQCTDTWPGAAELAAAKEALEKNGQPDEALLWFAAAKDAVPAARPSSLPPDSRCSLRARAAAISAGFACGCIADAR